MRPFSKQFEDPIQVPVDCQGLENDFQRVLYVENRLSSISTLKHDRLKLKDRFLQCLVPPEVQMGFSEEINVLRKEISRLESDNHLLTSRVTQLKNSQLVIRNIVAGDNHVSDQGEPEETDHPRHSKSSWIVIGALILISFYSGWNARSQVLQYSPGTVDSVPVGDEHSSKGGTSNGQDDQPQQGPSPQIQDHWRFSPNH